MNLLLYIRAQSTIKVHFEHGDCMSAFIGRKQELKKLYDLQYHGRPCLVVIKGRRRIGKSRLVEEFGKNKRKIIFSGLAPSSKTNAQNQRDVFARQFAGHFQLPPLTFTDWMDAFSHLTKQLTNEPTVILLDEISWMGSKDTTFISKLKNWWDLELQKFPSLVVIFCGSVSTWIEKNILNSAAFFGRITLTLTLNELSLFESAQFLRERGIKASYYDMFTILSITGGVPWYLEQILPHVTIDANIKRLAFEKDGLFTLEFEKIFHDLYHVRSPVYSEIIRILSIGMKTLEELRTELRYARSGTLSQMIKALMISGFVTAHHSWMIKTEKISKKGLYRLSDNYLRFFLKYIEPNLSNIEKGGYQELSLSALPGWKSILGFQVENMLLNNRSLLLQSLGLHPHDIVADNPYYQRQTNQHKGVQIDYLVQTRTKSLFFCEFKFTKQELGFEVIEEMKEKIKRFAAPSGFGLVPVLFHLGEVSDAVHEAKYFYRIIDITDFLTKENPLPIL